jgi:putative oxidoreductase
MRPDALTEDNDMSAALPLAHPSRSPEPSTLASALAPLAPLLLRAAVGFGLVMHGYAKLARGPESFAVVLHTLGLPWPGLLAWLTTFVELIGGLAVVAGAFLPLVSVPLAIVLLTAMLTIHRPYGFFSVKLLAVTSAGTTFGPVGYEIILLYLAGLGALAVGGAGPLSVDRWRATASSSSSLRRLPQGRHGHGTYRRPLR